MHDATVRDELGFYLVSSIPEAGTTRILSRTFTYLSCCKVKHLIKRLSICWAWHVTLCSILACIRGQKKVYFQYYDSPQSSSPHICSVRFISRKKNFQKMFINISKTLIRANVFLHVISFR